jgi:ubiquinone/menaquinone biosynthesis C-methylase UbiE
MDTTTTPGPADNSTTPGPPGETFQLTAELAEAYEAHFVPAFFAQWAPPLLDAAGVGAGQRVLDVACGTGIVARTAAGRVGPGGAVTGLDLNEAMLAVARRIRPDLTWRQGDAAALPFESGTFDAVLSQMALMFFPDPAGALREMARVARPGGAVAVLIPAGTDRNPPYQRFADIVARHAGPAARALVGTYFALGDRTRLVGLFESAALQGVQATSPTGESRYASIDQAVQVELDSTPLGGRLEPGVRARILADCRVAFAPYQTPAGVALPFESLLVMGHAP